MQSSSPTYSWEHYKTVSIHRARDTELKEKQTLDVFVFISIHLNMLIAFDIWNWSQQRDTAPSS